MLFTDNQLDRIHSVLDQHGFLGSKNKQVYFTNSPTRTCFSYSQSLAKELFETETSVENLRGYGTERELTRKLADYLNSIPYQIVINEGSNEEKWKRLQDIVTNFKILHSVRVGALVERYTGKLEKGDVPILIYDTKGESLIEATQISITSILAAMGLSRKIVTESIDSIEQVFPVFDPYMVDRFFIRTHPNFGEFTHINIYNPPTWRKRKVTPQLRGFFKTLFEHLFVNTDEREYVYLWLRTAILERNETILYLKGRREIGKSIFSDILRKLVGKEYSELGKKEHITKQFNRVFVNNRAIIFEEVHFDDQDDAVDRLKAFCNGQLAVEEKGKDSYTAVNYSSIVFCVNHNRTAGFSSSERRFSIPKLTDTRLLEVIESEVIGKYKRQLDAELHEEWFDVELAEFGQFLLQFESKYFKDTLQALRGEYFQECCYQNLRDWQRNILGYILKEGVPGEPISFQDLRKAATKTRKSPGRPLNIVDGTISEFISDFLYRSKYHLGEVVGGDSGDAKYLREYYLIPNEKLLKEFGVGKETKQEDETDDLFNLL